uniref:Uncharacterized protein n=1 Tax=Ralstonia syzygii R24 TaxID=907261 RepID=G3ABM8_9RALS|nr:hypothetical protein RALSY_mp30246 [Ralstonia syzygii R24]
MTLVPARRRSATAMYDAMDCPVSKLPDLLRTIAATARPPDRSLFFARNSFGGLVQGAAA